MVREKTAEELLFEDEEENTSEEPTESEDEDEDDDLDKNLEESKSEDDDDEVEEDSSDDVIAFDGDDENLKKKEKRGRPRKEQPTTIKSPRVVSPKAKFVAYKQTASEGIIDQETGETIASTEWEFRAEILNRLEELRDLIGR